MFTPSFAAMKVRVYPITIRCFRDGFSFFSEKKSSVKNSDYKKFNGIPVTATLSSQKPNGLIDISNSYEKFSFPTNKSILCEKTLVFKWPHEPCTSRPSAYICYNEELTNSLYFEKRWKSYSRWQN